jgi:hypothetical protein
MVASISLSLSYGQRAFAPEAQSAPPPRATEEEELVGMNGPDAHMASPAPVGSPAFVKIMVGLCSLALLGAGVKVYSVWSRSTASRRVAARAPEQSSEPDSQPLPEAAPALLPTEHRVPPPPVRPDAGQPADAGSVVFSTLPAEIDSGFPSPLTREEAFASYRVPTVRAPELQQDLDTITASRNKLDRLKAQIAAARAGFRTLTLEYLGHARAADAAGQGDRAAAARKLLDMQALYLERKQQYQQEIAMLHPSLRDPLPVLDQKLTQSQQIADRYKKDIHDLETGIYALQQQVYSAKEQQSSATRQMEQAYLQASQEQSQTLAGLESQVHEQTVALNALIRNYNATLKRYGSAELAGFGLPHL